MWCTFGDPGSGSTATTLIFSPGPAPPPALVRRSESKKDLHHTSVFPERNSSCTPGAWRAGPNAVVSGNDATSMRTSTGTASWGSVGMDARDRSRSFCFDTSYVAEGGEVSEVGEVGETATPGSDAPARLGVPLDPSRDTSRNTPGDPPARAGTARPTARSAKRSARKRVVYALRRDATRISTGCLGITARSRTRQCEEEPPSTEETPPLFPRPRVATCDVEETVWPRSVGFALSR
jgi:hypothetical protein